MIVTYALFLLFLSFVSSADGSDRDEWLCHEKVQVGKDQEKAQSEKDSHSKNRGGKRQTNNQVLIP